MEGTVIVSLLKINETNLNGRIYTKETAELMISQFEERRNRLGVFFGELGYPEDGSRDISLGNVSHDVQKMWLDGDTVYGSIKILDTPSGRKLTEMFKDNQMVFRSRSEGTIDPKTNEVQLTKLFSIDAVPADTDAFKGMFGENKNELTEKLLSFSDLSEETLKENGISSIAVIAERTMAPSLVVKYTDDSTKSIRGLEEITSFLETLIKL